MIININLFEGYIFIRKLENFGDIFFLGFFLVLWLRINKVWVWNFVVFFFNVLMILVYKGKEWLLNFVLFLDLVLSLVGCMENVIINYILFCI